MIGREFISGLNIQLEPNGGGGVANKRIFIAGQTYTTDIRETKNKVVPPGPAPEGMRWSSRKDKNNGFRRVWSLVSATPEVPSMDDLPPVGPDGKVLEIFQPTLIED